MTLGRVCFRPLKSPIVTALECDCPSVVRCSAVFTKQQQLAALARDDNKSGSSVLRAFDRRRAKQSEIVVDFHEQR
jgi:hypothetical protein